MPSTLAIDPDLYLTAFVESVKDMFPASDPLPFLKSLRTAALFGSANVDAALANLQDWAGVNISASATASQFVRSLDLPSVAQLCQSAIQQIANEEAGITPTSHAYGAFNATPSELG